MEGRGAGRMKGWGEGADWLIDSTLSQLWFLLSMSRLAVVSTTVVSV